MYMYMCIYIYTHVHYIDVYIPNILNTNRYSQLETHHSSSTSFRGAPADGVCPKPGEVRNAVYIYIYIYICVCV